MTEQRFKDPVTTIIPVDKKLKIGVTVTIEGVPDEEFIVRRIWADLRYPKASVQAVVPYDNMDICGSRVVLCEILTVVPKKRTTK